MKYLSFPLEPKTPKTHLDLILRILIGYCLMFQLSQKYLFIFSFSLSSFSVSDQIPLKLFHLRRLKVDIKILTEWEQRAGYLQATPWGLRINLAASIIQDSFYTTPLSDKLRLKLDVFTGSRSLTEALLRQAATTAILRSRESQYL